MEKTTFSEKTADFEEKASQSSDLISDLTSSVEKKLPAKVPEKDESKEPEKGLEKERKYPLCILSEEGEIKYIYIVSEEEHTHYIKETKKIDNFDISQVRMDLEIENILLEIPEFEEFIVPLFPFFEKKIKERLPFSEITSLNPDKHP